MTWIIKAAQYSELIAGGSGILFNLILFYLIMTVNKANMKRTSRILLQKCLFDLLISVTTLFAGFVMLSKSLDSLYS